MGSSRSAAVVHTAARLGLTAALLVTSHGAAMALNRSYCDYYAQLAVDTVKRLQANRCPVGDLPRWGDDYRAHWRWCMYQADQETANSETEIRRNVEVKCVQCRQYADETAKQQQASDKMQCGFSFDPEAEFAACFNTYNGDNDAAMWLPDSKVNQNLAARDNQLQGCKACRDYAANEEELVKQYFKVFHCTGLTLGTYDGTYFSACMQALNEHGYDSTFQSNLNADNSSLKFQLNQCKKEKKEQIDFCENYVQATVDARLRGAQGCLRSGVIGASYASDGRYSADDETRLSWCMGLNSHPADDPNFKSQGVDGTMQNPADALEGALKACRTRAMLSTSPQDIGIPNVSGGVKPYGISRSQSGKSDAATRRRCREMNPTLARLSKDCATPPPGGGQASVDHAKNPRGGSASVSRAAGDGPSKAFNPGLLDSDSGLGRNTPGAVGGGGPNTGRAGGSQNLR